MNDLIKKLAEQAGISNIDGNWDYNDREVLKREDGEWVKAMPSQIISTLLQSEKSLEKFAELILDMAVAECHTLAAEFDSEYARADKTDLPSHMDAILCYKTGADTAREIAGRIKTKFGVKS